jgi:4-hydroxy-tetrahydrodipicolinate reductase
MMEKLKIVMYGLGAVGSLIAEHLLQKEGVQIVGALDISEQKAGRDLAEILGLKEPVGVVVAKDAEAVISGTDPHIALHATSSYLKEVFPQIAAVVKRGVNVVSTCEELSYPYFPDQRLARRLDSLAKKHDVTVLGTGINPGFLMDTLAITLTAVCQRIERIEVIRVINAATRRASFRKKIGAGLSLNEFERALSNKLITGHVGLEQSIAMIGAALAWSLDTIQVDPVEPIIAAENVVGERANVEAGHVAGLKQVAKGKRGGRDVITLSFQASIGADDDYDSILVEGLPRVNQKISPGVHGDLATVAMVVNSIPKVINAPAGLVTMKDLPVPSATPGNLLAFLAPGIG